MGFLDALGFLTVIRVGGRKIFDDRDVASWGRYFFFAGLVIGGLTAGLDFILMKKFSVLLSSVFCVLFIAILNGGLHLDGLSDVFDAAFSMKSKEEKLAIMKKSDIGVFGCAAVVFSILLKVALLTEQSTSDRFMIILLFPAISRVCILIPAYLYDYPRETGKAAGFVKYMTSSILIFGLITAIVISYIILQEKGVLLLVSAVIFSAATARFFNGRIGGVTGDVLGAVNELTEIFVLLIALLK